MSKALLPHPRSASSRRRPSLPPSPKNLPLKPPWARTGMRLMTPPTASAPHRAEYGPLAISIRFRPAVLNRLQSKPPKNGELRRTPSSITRVWLELVPRVKTEVSLLSSPEPITVTPGTRRNIAATDPDCASSISSRDTTVTAVGASSTVGLDPGRGHGDLVGKGRCRLAGLVEWVLSLGGERPENCDRGQDWGIFRTSETSRFGANGRSPGSRINRNRSPSQPSRPARIDSASGRAGRLRHPAPERPVPGHSGGGRAGFTPASLVRSVGATIPRASREVPDAGWQMPDEGGI